MLVGPCKFSGTGTPSNVNWGLPTPFQRQMSRERRISYDANMPDPLVLKGGLMEKCYGFCGRSLSQRSGFKKEYEI